MTMALSETTLHSTMKGCAAMFPVSADTTGSQAECTSNSAMKSMDTYCTRTIDDMHASKAEITMRLMLMAGKALSGKTLGIVGFGQAGRETAHRAHFGFGMKIVVHNRSAVPDADLGQFEAEQVDDIDHLLNRSDFVSLHCPVNSETRHLVDALRLNTMKPDAYLINTAGAELVDEEALADALWYDTIAGAGLHLIPNEPAVCDRLCGCENVILLPFEDSAIRNAPQAA